MNQPNPKDLLLGSSTPIASYDANKGFPIGTRHHGKVIKEEVSQQTKLGTGELEFWDAEKTRPKWQMVLTVQRDDLVSDDNPDGLLRFFLSGGALQAAQKKARELGIESFLHGNFGLTWTGTKPAKTQGYNDAKLYEADFTPGVAPQQAALLGGGQPQETWQATPQQAQEVLQREAAAQQVPPQPVQQPAINTQSGEVNAGAPTPQVQDAAAAIIAGLGAVQVPPLDPNTAQQVAALHGAGLTDPQQIVDAFAKYGTTVTLAQVQQALPF